MLRNGNGFPLPDLGAAIARYNTTPQVELLGLSPHQAAALLDGDWRTVGALRLNQALTPVQTGPVRQFRLALQLLRELLDRGPAAATATGNLARSAVARMLEELEFPPGYVASVRRYNKVINEPDVALLHGLRLALVTAGYMRRNRGFRITARGRTALDLAERAPGAVFARLFMARMGVTAPFLDDEGRVFRSPIGPALFLLQRHAADWIDSLELTDRLLIPALVPHDTPAQLGFSAYQWVLAPCEEFGLLERREGPTGLQPDRIRVTPLFGEFIGFPFA